MIRKVNIKDAAQIADIYNYYILNTTITFEEKALSDSDMAERIQKISAKYPFLVYEEEGRIIGYAYASEWKTRAAYRNSVEITVYLKDGYGRKGIGKQLYTELFAMLKNQKVHAVIGGIAMPNAASVALHEKFNMKKIAHFKEVGYKFNTWVDVAYWEIILD